MKPVRASSEYTVPSSLPRKRRPAAIVGWPNVDVAFGNPKAHFSFKAGTCCAVRPGSGWKRVFARSTPQPFQAALPLGLAAVSAQEPARDSTAALTLDRNSATVRRSLTLRAAPCG